MEGHIANYLAVDANMVKDTDRFSMDLVGGLQKTLHGEVKPSTFFHGKGLELELIAFPI